MNDSELASARGQLLDWYDRNRRDLPWRSPDPRHQDPYRVWLSETMLQQTRVETVRPYYGRWVERFPTLEALAAASLDEVLKSWEGLGYYSRARNFHRAVREVSEKYGGRVPSDPEAFRALPGVGRYTAGAVMSIAFGLEQPVVDGNVRRVYSRWLDCEEPADRVLWDLASRIVVGERPGCLNQAVMELGATVCTPRSPRCDACPVASGCAARAAGTQLERPRRRRRGPLPREARVAAVVERDGRFLLGRRPTGARLGGLWEFPGARMVDGEDALEALPRLLRASTGLELAVEAPVAVVDHTFTHVRVSYHAVAARMVGGSEQTTEYAELRWFRPDEIAGIALPKAQQRIAAIALSTLQAAASEP